jgi:O-acetylhomoserine/O-acetylserine sulfhydrylase-like pyridoxal-dependent enzyme
MPHIRLTKFDAIRAQLDAAIELFFTSDNVVATHTLAAAAYNALKDIAKREGAEHPFIKTEYLQSLPDEERDRAHKLLHEPENFFKHADRDPTGEISFNAELTELLLIDACAYFRSGEIERPKNYGALIVWAGKTKESIPEDSDLRVLVDTVREVLKSKGKREFWVMFNQYLLSRHDA